MKYWRHYPKFMQTLLLMLMIFTMASFSFLVASFCVKMFVGIPIDAIGTLSPNSPPKVISAAQLIQGITSIFTFLLSSLLFANLSHPKPFGYLGLRKVQNLNLWLIVPLLMIAFVPIITQIGEWMQLIDFGTKAKADYTQNMDTIRALMSGTSLPQLLLYLFLFAAVPAMGEELLFRGVLMRFSYVTSNNIHIAVLLSAAIFGMAHATVYNFVPIMLAGVLLGYIYYFSGSIWLSILAHFLNNAVMVIALYLGNTQVISEEASKAESFPWYVVLIAISLFVFLFSLLRKNATPLPTDWTDDFKGERKID